MLWEQMIGFKILNPGDSRKTDEIEDTTLFYPKRCFLN